MPGQTDENRLHVLRHAAFTARDVREMERPLLENGVPLMRMASAATAHVVAEMIEDEGVALEESNIVLLAGSGDNGGDGLFAATMLASNGASVTAVAVGRTLHGEGFAAFRPRRRQGADPRPGLRDSGVRCRLQRWRGR